MTSVVRNRRLQLQIQSFWGYSSASGVGNFCDLCYLHCISLLGTGIWLYHIYHIIS